MCLSLFSFHFCLLTCLFTAHYSHSVQCDTIACQSQKSSWWFGKCPELQPPVGTVAKVQKIFNFPEVVQLRLLIVNTILFSKKIFPLFWRYLSSQHFCELSLPLDETLKWGDRCDCEIIQIILRDKSVCDWEGKTDFCSTSSNLCNQVKDPIM